MPPASTVTVEDKFETDFLGLKVRQDYRVINLWQVDASIVFDQSISTLLPFVPVLKGGGEPDVVQRAVQQLRLNESLSELEPLLGFFASFVLDTELVSQILRWDMAVLRESPWYQEIQKECEQTGVLRGKLEGQQALVFRLLNRRIGNVSPTIQAQVQSLPLSQLEALGEALLEFSEPNDLVEWLHQM